MRNNPKQESPASDAARLMQALQAIGRVRSLRDPLAALAEETQLTGPQMHALMWLGGEGGLTMGDIARRLGITEKTVTGLVDRLERDHYLKRERDEQDRRVVRCHLTAMGQKVYRELRREILANFERFLGLLDEPDRTALFRILDKFIQRLGEIQAAHQKDKDS